MVLYAVIMFTVAVLFLVLGILIHNGHTKLIHDYHQTKVREADRKAYGRAFAKGMFAISLALAMSGAASLFGETKTVGAVSVAILFVGMIAGLIVIIRVQKRYNGGLF